MGGICSKKTRKRTSTADSTGCAQSRAVDQSYKPPPGVAAAAAAGSATTVAISNLTTSPDEGGEETKQKPSGETLPYANANDPDDFYDGIPRYTSFRSRSTRSKVSEVSSRIGRAGTVGLGKAVEVLDNLSSSMTNLNASSGFSSGPISKGNELSILSFEVANTIVKGSNLMQSLSKRNIRHLTEEVLTSEAVQNLISKDIDELLWIVAADKREELKVFLGEVIRFGNLCKDPQWHNLDRYFEKIGRELTPQRQLKEEAESVIDLLMTMVQYTAELYHELQVLDRIDQSHRRKLQGEDKSASNHKGDSLAILKSEIKSQKKQVRNLKKKSLWSRSMEEVMEKLVDIVHFLLLEIHNTFRTTDGHVPVKGSISNHQKLGPAGLSLHYANVVMQIDTLTIWYLNSRKPLTRHAIIKRIGDQNDWKDISIKRRGDAILYLKVQVSRSSSVPPNARDTLYLSLPPSIKSALRSKLHSFQVKEEFTTTEIKDEMEKTLHWLVPISTKTAKAHHGFGWVGEWANSGSEMNRKSAALPADIMQIETLHHADKDKTESYILELLLWLHHLVIKAKAHTLQSQIQNPNGRSDQQPEQASASTSLLTAEEQDLLQEVTNKKRTRGISKSQDFDSDQTMLRKHDRLSKSTRHSPSRKSKDVVTFRSFPSVIPILSFGKERERALDAIDRVEVVR